MHYFIERLSREVREGKNVMLASQYARWVEFSGLVRLLELVDRGANLGKKLNDLLFECGEMFKDGKADPKYAASDIAEINRKLDLLLVHGHKPGACQVDGEISEGGGLSAPARTSLRGAPALPEQAGP
jgi:hypothetical protein